MAKKGNLKQQVTNAISACVEKKAEDIAVLEMEKDSGTFTDYFVVCSGTNPRQIQAISDEVEQRLSRFGMRPTHIEGYNQADWVLLDYVDFVVHVFSQQARKYYDLERLWKAAKRLQPADLEPRRSRAGKERVASSGAEPARVSRRRRNA
jgi:ribosome-associated protein